MCPEFDDFGTLGDCADEIKMSDKPKIKNS